jgi:hypothetical protein
MQSVARDVSKARARENAMQKANAKVVGGKRLYDKGTPAFHRFAVKQFPQSKATFRVSVPLVQIQTSVALARTARPNVRLWKRSDPQRTRFIQEADLRMILQGGAQHALPGAAAADQKYGRFLFALDQIACESCSQNADLLKKVFQNGVQGATP